jgi:phage terminase small subunit
MAIKTDKLTIKQQRFADALFAMEVPNQRQAYIQAGYKARGAVADSKASRLVRNGKVRAYLQKLRDKATERTLIDGVKIINEYAKLAFTDISDYIDIDKEGNVIFRPFDTIDKEKLAAIESIKKRSKTTSNKDGTEHTTTTKEIKLHSKLNALDSLGKHFGVFDKDNTPKATKDVVIVNFADIPIED